jgi:hypothetical protein
MNKSNISVPSAGATVDNDSTVQNQQVSQPNANTNVVGSLVSQREIKFRARRNDIKGDFLYFTLKDISDLRGLFSVYEDWCQFTGLKDKYDKEIYDGDIVKHAGWLCKVIYGVEGAAFSLVTKDNETDLSLISSFTGNYIEIIGNVFENPELLQTL